MGSISETKLQQLTLQILNAKRVDTKILMVHEDLNHLQVNSIPRKTQNVVLCALPSVIQLHQEVVTLNHRECSQVIKNQMSKTATIIWGAKSLNKAQNFQKASLCSMELKFPGLSVYQSSNPYWRSHKSKWFS